MKRQLAYLGAALGCGFLLSFGCLATGGKGLAGFSEIPPLKKVTARESEIDEEELCEEGCVKIPGIDLESIVFVLDDPRLSDVKAALKDNRPADAASSLEKAIAKEEPEGVERLRWEYQLGRLHTQAGNWAMAAEAFDRACEEDWPLISYARLGAAQGYARAGRGSEALLRAEAVAADLPIFVSARVMQAEILAAQGEKERAIPIWRELLRGEKKPIGWPTIANSLAEALLEGGGSLHAEEAASLSRQVIIEAPTLSAATEATGLYGKALAKIPESRQFPKLNVRQFGEVSASLSPIEHISRASSLFSAGRRSEAERTVDAVLALPPSRLDQEALCEGNLLKAKILARNRERAKASDIYGLAITHCERHPASLADALLGGGRAASAVNRCSEAMRRFERIERELPSHSYADDARLHGSLCALELGDRDKHAKMLSTIADDYPEGDMSQDGLFRLALHHMVEGEWREALPLLERYLAIWPDDRRYWGAGRARYFRGKALSELGKEEEAKKEWARVIRDNPLSYYMVHAYARLAERDPKIAEQLLDTAMANEPRGPFELADLPIFRSEGFARTIELIQAGEVEAARREVQAMNVTGKDMPSDVLWAVSLIYARTGSARLAHMLPRGVLKDWLEHYPVGKWRAAWELAYPRPWQDIVEREAERSGIGKSLAYAVMRDESAFDEEAVSPARAYGLMQLIVPTAKSVGTKLGISPTVASLKTPEVNIALGCQYLADLERRFSNNPALAIPSYNAGPGGPLRWIRTRKVDDFDLWVEQIPYLETRKYTQRVLTSYAAYLFLYERDKFSWILNLPATIDG